MDSETQKLLEALKVDQVNALAADAKKIRENAAVEVEKKIEASNLANDLKQPLSDYVRAKITKSDD